MERDGTKFNSVIEQIKSKYHIPDEVVNELPNDVDINKFHAEKAKEYTQKYLKRKYTDMFIKDSIFSDPDLKNATFDNFKVSGEEQAHNLSLAKHYAYDYCKGKTFNTLLVGDAGRGKTHLSISMLKAVNKYMHDAGQRFSCLFIDVNSMMEKIMQYEFKGGDSKYSKYNMIKLCTLADLLVLDDLGTESSMKSDDTEANNMTQRVLYSILNARNKTIITTNLSSKQMDVVYNSKLNSRIKRSIGNHIIQFTDATKDMRQEGIQW